MIRISVILVTICSAALLTASFMGALHPAGDSLAVFRSYLALALLACGLILFAFRRRWRGGIALLFAIISLPPLYWPDSRAGAFATSGSGLSLYQKNMLFRMPDPAVLGRDILTRAPDFVTLQEVSGVNLAILDELGTAYPSRQFCSFASVGGVAVAARWPMVEGSGICAEHDGLAAMRVNMPDGPVWVVSIHLHWPWPHSQSEQVGRLLPLLAGLSGAKVIGGDFNMVPWSYRMRQIARRTGTNRLGPAHITLIKSNGWLRVPIDHVLVSGTGRVERLPLLGSDHFGLLARFHLTAPD